MSDTDKLSRYFSRRVNLLIIEDNANLLLALKGIFSIPSFNVTGVSSLERAKEVIARPGTIWHSWIVDMCLAGNVNAGAEIIENNRYFPFAIVYSGLRSMENAAQAVQKGAAAVIDKGVDTADRLIREVCELVPLAFLCKGTMFKNREILFLLKNQTVRATAEWAEAANMTIRQLENITTTQTGMPPSLVIPFYYGLRHLLLLSFGGKSALTYSKENRLFFQSCVPLLQENLAFYKKNIFLR
ncbi:MAG: response regulator [Chitinispirillaceae bacterium]|jgi:CheY-like chemotaxis protein